MIVGLLAGCGGSATSIPAGAVGKVGNVTISKQRVTALLAEAKVAYKQQKKAWPKQGTKAYRLVREQAVAYLVQEAMIEQQAAGLGIHVTASQINATISVLKQQDFSGNEQKFQAGLAKQGLTLNELRAEEKLRLIENQLQTKITGPAKVSDKEAKAYYASHKSQFLQPESREVRHILVPTKTQADDLYQQLLAGADFAALAKQYSKDPGSAAKGGDLTVYKGQTVPVFDKTAFSIKTDQIAAPVHSQYGWHIIEALGPIKPAKQQSYKQAAATIKANLLQSDQQNLLKTFTNKMDHYYCDGRIHYAAGYTPTQKQNDPCKNLVG